MHRCSCNQCKYWQRCHHTFRTFLFPCIALFLSLVISVIFIRVDTHHIWTWILALLLTWKRLRAIPATMTNILLHFLMPHPEFPRFSCPDAASGAAGLIVTNPRARPNAVRGIVTRAAKGRGRARSAHGLQVSD